MFNIVIAPSKVLKTKTQIVDKVDDNIRKFMDQMLATMYENRGVGLAAPQVGVGKRITVIDVDSEWDEENEKIIPGNPIYLVNPEIVNHSKEINVHEEGCLSFPGFYEEVTRPKRVKVKYLDYNGNEQAMDCDGLLATCVQHEIDHLDGITFVDYLSKLKKDRIIKKLQKTK